MSVGFELSGGGIAVGTLFSTELKGSDAPLLLSMSDQRKLGLTLELGEGGDKVVATNGLLGIRLLPSHVAMLSKMPADEEDEASANAGIPLEAVIFSSGKGQTTGSCLDSLSPWQHDQASSFVLCSSPCDVHSPTPRSTAQQVQGAILLKLDKVSLL